ncbi:MAG: N-acetyl sugar amidotransferase [Candidatus Bathyarchaeota archaeon]|nr:N-acetyl sugar amidotransferase [Candidatus Bathyarchaeota archaeon]
MNKSSGELRRCSRCVLPETHETILFDHDGVCNICRQHETKRTIDWDQRKKELDALIDENRGKYDYDCIVPFSGGKDSTWTLYYLVKECNVKPLVVRFDHGFLRPNVLENTQRTMRKLGVDFHTFTPNWKVVRQLMLESFIDKGDFCWHCHTGIFAYPMWVAIEKKVPLVFWGEPSAEYTSYYSYDQPEEVDEKRFNRYTNLGISAQDMQVRLNGSVDSRDMKPFTYPPIKELRRLGYRSVCLGSFIPWDVKSQSKIIKKELGWKGDIVENVPPDYDYEKIECYLQGVRDYIKFIKRGYSRPTHLASLDIRNGRLNRKEALEMIAKYEGKRPRSLDIFLELLGLSEEEFMQIAMNHKVSPYDHDPTCTAVCEKLHDYEMWSKEGGMDRDLTQRIIKRSKAT